MKILSKIEIPKFRYHSGTKTVFEGNYAIMSNIPDEVGYNIATALNAAYNKGYRDRGELIKEGQNELG